MNPCACGCGQLSNRSYVRGHHWAMRAEHPVTEPPNPSGLCMCGCGAKTAIATVTIHSQKKLKGFPVRYVPHHGYSKFRKMTPPNPSGLCQCGCGCTTSISKYTSTVKGVMKGEHLRWIHNHHQEPYPPEESYKVEDRGFETPCWIWQRWRDKNGYGAFDCKGKTLRAHRYFYEKYVAPIEHSLEVHHRCHVTSCVNPAHLQAVTNIYNERHKRETKLSMAKARVIRQLFDWDIEVGKIATAFRVKNYTIWAVVNHKTWKERADYESAPKLLIPNC